MAKTSIKKRVCTVCEADLRKDALFCYHCGGSVAPEILDSAANGDAVSGGWFREKMTDEEAKIKEAEKPKVTSKLDGKVVEKIDEPIEKPIDLPLEKPVEKTKEVEATKLKSAAEMRRKARTQQKKLVEEVVWEEYENAPNGWFLLVALILILIATGIFFLTIYVK
ncbi:hypothetical protein BH10ACI1_BH10ACI1_35170 [soil metagenome]